MQVIDLVLERAGEQAGGLELDLLAVEQRAVQRTPAARDDLGASSRES